MKEIPVIDPRRDIVFKTIFGKQTEKANIARNSLISAFLGRQVSESYVINNELPIENVNEKSARLDLHCILADKTKVNVEMQLWRTADSLIDRLSYHASHLYVSQALRGKPFKDLKEVYVILISNTIVFPNRKEHFSNISYRFPDGESFGGKQHILVLELKKLENKCIIKPDDVEKWALFFNSATDPKQKEIMAEILEKEEGIKMAQSLLENITQDEKEQALVFLREKMITDYYAELAIVERTGLERGRSEGLEQGSHNAFIKTARSLKARNFSTEDILEITGLSEGEY